MVSPSPFTAAERWESLKAAILGGVVAATVAIAILLGRALLIPRDAPLAGLELTGLWGQMTLINGAIAAFSGALFALTYRYGVRQDTNPQLKGGVVLAFTLVRGLALVDVGAAIAHHYWPFFAASLESLLLFGITGLLLDLSLVKGWITPFQN
ncbi:MAG: hypothetical protein O2890_01455 [Cyanobacteria bacterium]|nr:hypothetical protein [Cyanobacteriota bacterium]MDA0865086.1 hypothetical protein [Cyanobacteriota bacterium]